MWWCWWGRTAPARPIASRRSRSCRRDAACAAPRWTMSPTSRATAPGRYPPRSKARSGSPRSAPASTRRRREAASASRRCRIDRETGGLGHRLRRSSAHGVADAGDGRAVHGRGLRAAAVLRSPGAGDRQRAFGRVSALERSLRSRNRLLEVRNFDDHWCDAIERETAELAVAVAAMRGQTRDEARGDAARAAARDRRFRPPRSRSTAGWKTRC